jgi:hypothetical protein
MTGCIKTSAGAELLKGKTVRVRHMPVLAVNELNDDWNPAETEFHTHKN